MINKQEATTLGTLQGVDNQYKHTYQVVVDDWRYCWALQVVCVVTWEMKLAMEAKRSTYTCDLISITCKYTTLICYMYNTIYDRLCKNPLTQFPNSSQY